MYPFERFSDPAKKALTLSQEEAVRAHHSYIGTEHLLIGLLREPDGLANRVLSNLSIEIDEVRRGIESVLGRNERIIVQQIIPTSRVKRVIELSFEESRRAGRGEVTTGDMLLGLLIEGEGVAAHVLKDVGVRVNDVRAELAGLSVAGIKEESAKPARAGWQDAPRLEAGPGSRVLVHDPEPPHRLWEGHVVASQEGALVVQVPDRPAGERVTVSPRLVHPVPGGPTFMCEYCRAHL